MAAAVKIDPAATRWSRAPEHSDAAALVLLHGYGADEHDLFGLVPQLPAELTVASVAAPLTLPAPMPGRAWYSIDDLSDRDPESVTAAGEALLSWLSAELPSSERIALLGFSQGAAVALQALRLAPERFRAVVALSGYTASGELPGDQTLSTHPVPVFWGRGSHDQVIPPPLIEHTSAWLPAHAKLTERVYAGLAHGICEQELVEVNAFLQRELLA